MPGVPVRWKNHHMRGFFSNDLGQAWLRRRLPGTGIGAGASVRRRALVPALVDELRDLRGQAGRPDAQLHDRVRVDQPAVGELGGELVGIGERVDGVARMPDHERRRLERLPQAPLGRGSPEQDPLKDGSARPGVLGDRVEEDLGRERDGLPRHPLRAPGQHLHRRLAEREREQQRGEGGGAGRDRVVEHGHLDHHPAQALGCDRGQLERDVGSERGAAHHRLVEPEMVEQCQRLAGELGHRVARHLAGPVGGPVAEEVERDDPVPVRGEIAGQRRLHLLREQQGRHQHGGAGSLAVDRVGELVAFEPEIRHAVRISLIDWLVSQSGEHVYASGTVEVTYEEDCHGKRAAIAGWAGGCDHRRGPWDRACDRGGADRQGRASGDRRHRCSAGRAHGI